MTSGQLVSFLTFPNSYQEPTTDTLHSSLLPQTETEGFKAGEKKTLDEYANLDANDESLKRWKASLGLAGPAGSVADRPKLTLHSLALESAGAPGGKVEINLQGSKEELENYSECSA